MFKEKKIQISNKLEISYLDNELNDKKNLVFVHGWGADKFNLKAIYDNLKYEFRILSIDLPGFGSSSTPYEIAGSEDYAEYLYEFLNRLNFKNINYIGHSFGGKIGIILAGKYENLISRLVLIDSAGIRSKRGINWHLKIYTFKFLKIIFSKIFKSEKKIEKLKDLFGSNDYKNAGKLKNILVKVTQEDFTFLLDKIKCPVFLYWGEKDRYTPLWMAKKMNKLIKDSALYIVKKADHFPFLKDNNIIAIIKSFAV
ncbi:MAG: alpha/beta hydrolase [Spirochaetes bacterium]|nr:alpha/beta hydrolase [Spirochaetota bacterium]